jgi:hypothetical protein
MSRDSTLPAEKKPAHRNSSAEIGPRVSFLGNPSWQGFFCRVSLLLDIKKLVLHVGLFTMAG